MKYDELLETLNKDRDAVLKLSGQRGTQLKVFQEE